MPEAIAEDAAGKALIVSTITKGDGDPIPLAPIAVLLNKANATKEDLISSSNAVALDNKLPKKPATDTFGTNKYDEAISLGIEHEHSEEHIPLLEDVDHETSTKAHDSTDNTIE